MARRLRADGHELRCLVRATSETSALRAVGAALHVGDVTDRASMRAAMSGADWVIHAAAELDLETPRSRMEAVNVGGSENVASLAWKLGVPRVLALSSIAAFGGSPDDGSAADESQPPRHPFPSAYAATKHAADEAIGAWERKGLAVNLVHPSLVYGPPGKKGGANGLLRLLLQRRVPAVVGADRLAGWLFLADLVTGLVRVIERAPPGRRYLMSGEVATVGELVTEVCRLGGVEPPRWRLSPASARILLNLATPLYRLRGRRPPLSPARLRSLARNWNFDDARARRELAWTPRPLRSGLPPTIALLRSAG